MSEAFDSMDKRIDESWKERVQLEKQAFDQRAGAGPAPSERKRTAPEEPPLRGTSLDKNVEEAARSEPPRGRPKPAGTDFGLFVSSLSMQALMALGEVAHPATGQPQEDLEQARYLIDTLGMLQEKTKGNLTPEEAALLEEALYELRMKYVTRTGGS